MLLEIPLALLLGIIIGTFTGITPGIHINLIASLIPSLTFLSFVQPIYLVVFLVSMAITHTFTDFIPSLFLGAPDSDTALSVLPGHKMLLRGQGHYALKLTVIGSLIGAFSLIIVLPFLFLFLEKIYPFFNKMMGFFLIWAVIFLIMGEKEDWKKSLIIFLLSGIFGLVSLNIELKNPLLPILTGLFGIPLIISSIKNKTKIPKQDLKGQKIIKQDIIKPSIITIIISPIFSIFPGLGSSEAAVIGSRLGKRMSQDQFLILLGSINTLVMAVSFITLFLIEKSRSGIAVAISSLIKIGQKELILIIVTIFLSSILAAYITLKISSKISSKIERINYSKVSLIVLYFIILVNLFLGGFSGLFILIVASFIGLTCIKLNVRKSFLMGCLLLPTIIFYLPF
jgi:putative membrane protein